MRLRWWSMVERKYGKARRIWVFDRGIVSEENLAAIRRRGGQYLTGTPRSHDHRQRPTVSLIQDKVRPSSALLVGGLKGNCCRTTGRASGRKWK